MSRRRNRKVLEATRRKLANRPTLVVHHTDCGCSCSICGVSFEAGDFSVEVGHVLN